MRPLESEALALVGATVIDGTGASPKHDAVILIENGRIIAVGQHSATQVPDRFQRRDLSGLTVLPGLIDSHVHISFGLPRGPNDPQADSAINEVLQRFLRHGITSIRDVGGFYPWIMQLAKSVERGERTGPRIFAAGPMVTAPGGHPAGTLLRGMPPGVIPTNTRQIATADEGRAVVRELASGGVDLIKAVFDSRGRFYSPERIPTLNSEVLGAVVAEAHAVNLPVTVHWGNVEELPAIVALRPTQIEHAGYAPLPASVITEIADAGIAVDPTLVVLSAGIASGASAKTVSGDTFALGPRENVRRLRDAGVTITAGTDAPLRSLTFGESLHRELELLVEAGLSPMEAIQAATSRPASLLRRGDEIGTIQVGKRADLVAIAGDPLQAISRIRNVRIVIRDGRIFDFG
jgi:imidazolonepropionase-like amidohydrolase